MRAILASLILFSTAAAQEVQNPATPEILTLREQAALTDAWLEKRLDTVVPDVMRRHGVDMWVLIAREYNEDPVVETMLPATWLAARRRTVLVFFDDGERVERLAVARYPVGDVFPAAWSPEAEPDQWKRLVEIIEERDPKVIAINGSKEFALASGLSHQQYKDFRAALPRKYSGRLQETEDLAIGWLETRIPEEIAYYETAVRIAHSIIAEAFSVKVITPGETTTDDVVWWTRQKTNALGLTNWFHTSVSIARAEVEENPLWAAAKKQDKIIQPGDLLHIDFGITYLGLNTDTQHHAYVLKPGETDAPAGLKAGLAAANRVQDIQLSEMIAGRTSNEILKATREKALAEGLKPSLYSHPIGFHGHAAGSPIGWWDDQSYDHPKGYRALRPNTAWSIELNATAPVPEWGGQEVVFKTEEDAFFDGESVRYLDGRQVDLHLVGRG